MSNMKALYIASISILCSIVFLFPSLSQAKEDYRLPDPANALHQINASGQALANTLRDGISEISDTTNILGLFFIESINLLSDDIYSRYRISLERQQAPIDVTSGRGLVYNGKQSFARIGIFSNDDLAVGIGQIINGSKFLSGVVEFHRSIVALTNFYNQPIIQDRMRDGLEELSERYIRDIDYLSFGVGNASDAVYASYRDNHITRQLSALAQSFVFISPQ